jgi:hypothetical protein
VGRVQNHQSGDSSIRSHSHQVARLNADALWAASDFTELKFKYYHFVEVTVAFDDVKTSVAVS